ncbi:MAG: 4'-phosphopantetheinyl transferase superfamily protein [Clostridia bacterium]|nr:4'-phosphopantetheinyl transferase superfamily protein [Clostridia bacterium]
MVSVYFFKLSDKTEYNYNLLSANAKGHCKKKESLAAATALLSMGVENLHYDENNKPLADNCFVSISHSKDIIAVCKSDKPVGIDVEFMATDRDYNKIANRFYKGKELEYYNSSPTLEAFYEIWTKKEAFSKISGQGTIEIFEGFDVLSLESYKFQTEFIENFALSVCEKQE